MILRNILLMVAQIRDNQAMDDPKTEKLDRSNNNNSWECYDFVFVSEAFLQIVSFVISQIIIIIEVAKTQSAE